MSIETTKSILWSRLSTVANRDPRLWRADRFGLLVYWPDYGNRNSNYGWEIDHVVPKVRGGSDELSNLQILNWQSNAKKGGKGYLG